jgi:hypothetical protein
MIGIQTLTVRRGTAINGIQTLTFLRDRRVRAFTGAGRGGYSFNVPRGREDTEFSKAFIRGIKLLL